ncbi:uncharacterized protein [Parasteatoda tepidariorum]|uniref:uncharacterized protein n=1 Tax=Parasteatoda tepidariorum TaxID=114398 RepID=UPI001C71976F|nr:uncharacterized protein LOC107455316 [Parasteatoda tepidariorum]XP_042896028.1 uncharacterized protein LOC107455316 [Parasteatoda tepidariorum]
MENVKNSFKDTSFESESSKEFQATLRDRRKRPDKQLYVPRALRTKKDCSVSENIKDGSGVSLESSFNDVPCEGTKTESVSDINRCQSLRTKRNSSGCIKEELCDVEINFHDVLFKGVKTKSTKKNQHSLVRTERKNLVSKKNELSLEPCASESIFQDVPFQDAESQSASNENCSSTLATKKDGSVFVQDEVNDSVNISNVSSSDTVNSFESTCYPPNDKNLVPEHINAVEEDICSSKMPSETFNSSIFVPDFKINSENANIIEKEDGIHSFKDQNNAANYSKENFISCYQPLKERDEDSKILSECKNKIYESEPKELTVKQVLHDISPDILLVNEEMSQENGDINLNSYISNTVNISDNNQFCDGESFDNAKKNCDKPTPDEDSWETMFNDDGECLDPEFAKELCKVTGRMQIHVAKNNYSDYTPISDTSSNEYDCVVELYAFPVEFKTQDLVSSLSIFQQNAYSIKWVDDCHALAIFNSPTLANQALQLSSQFVKFRALSDGTKESKAKARLCSGQLEPCRPRPATSAVLARRLVSGALGLKDKTSKEQRALERNMLKEAKERKKLKAKQRQDIWDGVVL